ncbi:MAG TPA: hypothetical protein VKG45_16845 [Actinomycetes bacterium]|nr:hypothetical protein [Actinomycetes bacterium]
MLESSYSAESMADDEDREAALRRAGARWLEWLNDELARRGSAPRAQLLGLWDALEEWFASEDFRGSFLAAAAAELTEPGHGGGSPVLTELQQAVRQLLEDLAKAVGASDPDTLAGQLRVLVEGAAACALIDRQPAAAQIAKELTQLALEAQSA